MQVRDLIYMLQSRCKPDQEIHIRTMIKMADGSILEKGLCYIDDDFSSVFSDHDEEVCGDAVIMLPEYMVAGIIMSYEKGDFTKEDVLSESQLKALKAPKLVKEEK